MTFTDVPAPFVTPTTEHGRRFAGQVAIVTGASRGIGLAVAQRLVDEGARVVVTARKPEGLAEAAEQLGSEAVTVAGRADDPDHQDEAVRTAVERFGRLDVLVNNTGINPAYGSLLDLDEGAARKIMDVNVLAALAWTRRAIAAGLGREAAGAIVNMSSVAGLSPSPGIAYYGVSKGALINLTIQLAAELSPHVRVNAVAPAVVKTRFAAALYEADEAKAAAGYPLARLGVPEDIAAATAFLASSDAAWITGQTLVVDGGAALSPRL
ncbi:SDR family oxidoreductase [uncultured Jatrophihabitans sp.]|uniref:SDR family oxidoreductase n=1 Tax=uncultured Jatrophihabitans sp. TaxID=1610747 RepID=UPI0035C9954E